MSTRKLDLPTLTNVTIGEQSLNGVEKGQSSLSMVGMDRVCVVSYRLSTTLFLLWCRMLLVHGESARSEYSSISRSVID